MKSFKKGTPAFGVLLGCVFVGVAALIMWIGFWRTLLLAVLFCAGYFLGAVDKKGEYVREAVGRVIPEKKNDTIDFRSEVRKEQEPLHSFQEDGEDEEVPEDEKEV